MTDNAPRIAIIGMEGRFPGARNADEFWRNLVAGKESITRLTREQLAPNEPDIEALLKKSNFKTARGILEDVDLFDAPFFGFSPKEASVLDPQQRLWFEAAWRTLESAGVDPYRFDGPIGIFAGAGYMEQYLLYNLIRDRSYTEDLVKLRASDSYQVLLANDKDYLPTRTAFKFNLRGPAVNVQTACSTSLVALHTACQSLLSYESDLALAGAVSIALPQERGYLTQEGGMNSLDGVCRPFDADASGTVFSSGLGVFLLKRFDDAVDDGDDILAVIRGSALNNDGATKVSFLAPSPDGQADVVEMAQAVADVHPDDISYVEAHGTATPLGDPIEIDGLTRAWRKRSEATGSVHLGAVKSNIGHVDSAAGAAGLIKIVNSLREQVIPPTLHFTRPNPRIDFERSPFRVVDTLTPWTRSEKPRIAGLSSFGVGGTNAHLIVEEAPERKKTALPNRKRHLFVLSARTNRALEKRCADLADWLQTAPELELADVAWTLATGRTEMPFRTHVVVSSTEDAVARLRDAAKSAKDRVAIDSELPLVTFLFPGQGAQHPNMMLGLYEAESVFREVVDRLSAILEPLLGLDLRALLYSQNDTASAKKLQDTGIAQPALFVVQYALAKLWAHWGIEPDAMLGHSVGEYVAACISGVFSEEDCCQILASRAQLMSDLPGGSMLAVRRGEDQATELLGDDIALAAINGPQLCIVSGTDSAIEELAKRLEQGGEQAIRLHTSHAFHSPMMDPALEPFTKIVASHARSGPKIPFVSCLTGQWMSETQAADPNYWATQLRQAVRFSPALDTLLAEPMRVYVECGPSQNLTASVRQHQKTDRKINCIPSQPHASNTDQPADEALLDAVGRLWNAGVRPDWGAFFDTDEHPRRLEHLPAYVFDHKRYWIDPPVVNDTTRTNPLVDPLAHTMIEPEPAALEPRMTTQSRKSYLAGLLREIFFELSGTEITPADDALSFPEMGMDSLFLTQASAELTEKFGVPLRFRQLLEEINSLDLLAGYIDAELESGLFMPPALESTSSPERQPSSMPPEQRLSSAVGEAQHAARARPGANAAHDLVDRQLNLMQQLVDLMPQQLAVLNAEDHEPLPSTDREPPGATAPKTANQPVVQASLASGAQGNNLAATGADRFGPYKTVSRSKDAGLSAEQQDFLDALIRDLNQKTAESKKIAANERDVLADPRSVANFRLAWKEMVYQIVAAKTSGATMTDVDGNEYIDITMGFGVGFMGHRHPNVVEAVHAQLDKGFEVGPQTPLAPIVARKFCNLLGHERASFCNTGSEAVMAALRCARTVTNRSKVVYFTGDYHGTFDEVLARANIVRGNLTTRPAAPGIAQDAVDNVMILDYGTEASLDIIRAQSDQIAAVLIEPVQSRYPELQPSEFIRKVREITQAAGTALILDEVITGFRVALGGIKQLWDLDPDICCYGKILGGGMPIGAIGGKAHWLDAIDGGSWQFGDDSLPEAPVTFFAGTFVRHPIAMAAAEAVLDFLAEDDGALQQDLNERTAAFAQDMNSFFENIGAPIRIRQFSSWFRFDFPQDQPFINLLFYWMVANGVYVREAAQNCFFSIAHSDADIDRVKQVIREGVSELQAVGFIATGATAKTPPSSGLAGGDPSRISGIDRKQNEPGTSIRGLGIGETIPLTEAQQELWLAQAVFPDSAPAFNEVFYIDLDGSLDVGSLRAACDTIYQRHEALHLRISKDGQSQMRVEDPPLSVEMLDVTELPDPEAAALDAIREAGRTPFDLQDGPLLRVLLIHIAEDRHRIGFCVHHIACDGWSSVVWLEEVGQLYSALVQKREPALPSPVPFSSYAKTLAQRAKHSEASAQFWQQILSDLPKPLELPADRARPEVKTFNGDTCHIDFDSDLVAGARRTAGRLKVTPFVVLLSSFYVLLARLSKQYDLIVGIPVAGQALEGQNTLFGHCVQTLPIRVQFDRATPFSEIVRRVKSAVNDAYDHADLTFGSILQAVSVPREAGRLPLIDVSFNLDPAGEGVVFESLRTSVHEAPKTAIQWDIFFNLTQGSDSLVLDCDYNVDLYDAETIMQYAEKFQAILKQASEQPEIEVSALKLQDDKAILDQVQAFNSETAGCFASGARYDDATTAQLFKEQASATPEAVAVYHSSANWTFVQLDSDSNRIANCLLQIAKPGEVIGVHLSRAPTLISALIGIHKAGMGYLPLDPAYPKQRLDYMVADTGASCVLTEGEVSFDTRCVTVEEARQSADSNPEVSYSGDDLAYVIYTSGSTGTPKGVVITQSNVVSLLQWAHGSFELAHFVGMLASTSVNFDVSVFEIFTPLTNGGGLVLVEDAVALNSPANLPGTVTWVSTVPSAMTEIIRTNTLPESVKIVSLAGEPLAASLVDALYEQPGVTDVYDLYGPTESTVFATCARRERGGPETIGRPLPGRPCYILDEEGHLAPVGTNGELVVAGAGVALGYYNNQTSTDAAFIEYAFTDDTAKVYRTGDIARWRGDGQLEYIGRADHQVKIRGFRIELGEIESVLNDFDTVEKAVVTVCERSAGDFHLVAHWQPAVGQKTTPPELRKALQKILPTHMVPQQFIQCSEWPKTPSGKTDRNALQNPFASLANRIVQQPAIDSEAAGLLEDLWVSQLGPIEIAPNSTFFDLGGHSLLAVRAIAELKEHSGIDLPVREMMMDSFARLVGSLDRALEARGARSAEPHPESNIEAEKTGKWGALFNRRRR